VTYLDYIMLKIHHLFNEYEKAKVAYKCDQREYLSKLLLGWVTIMSLSLRRFVALSKVLQGRLSTTPPPG